MLDTLFKSVIDGQLTTASFFICTAASLVIGAVIAWAYTYKTRHTAGFVITLAMLPLIVQTVIMLVNGNIGAGVAVAGAFSLVRFRSAPGTAREIGSIFLAMAVGLACGMGYIGIAAAVAIIVSLLTILCTAVGFGQVKGSSRSLRITIPESLDYTEAFDEVMAEFTRSAELIKVKTTNMGSLFRLTYNVELKDEKQEKAFIDALRCRNGNLDIVCSRAEFGRDEL